jgi:hypothetical protein
MLVFFLRVYRWGQSLALSRPRLDRLDRPRMVRVFSVASGKRVDPGGRRWADVLHGTHCTLRGAAATGMLGYDGISYSKAVRLVLT